MRQNRNRIAAALAWLLGAGLLSGCGDTQVQSADTGSMLAEQTAAAAGTADEDMRGDINGDGYQDVVDAQLLMQYYVSNQVAHKPLSWAELLGKAPVADPKETERQDAERAMKRFLDALVEGDAEKVLKFSGMGDLMRLMLGIAKTDEELIADPSFTVNKIDSYTLGEVKEDPESLAQYQEVYTKSMEEAKNTFADKKAEASELRMAYLVQTILKPAEKMYSCHVSITAEGETKESDMVIACDDKGEWRVDLGTNAALANYSERSKISAVNSAANSLSKALNSALVDMDEEGIDVKVLNGDFTLTGEEFKSVGAVQYNPGAITNDQALDLLKIKTRRYFSAVDTMEYVSFRLTDGVCIAAAAQKKYTDRSFMGTYPILSEIPEGLTLTEVMQKVAEQYS